MDLTFKEKCCLVGPVFWGEGVTVMASLGLLSFQTKKSFPILFSQACQMDQREDRIMGRETGSETKQGCRLAEVAPWDHRVAFSS